MKHYKLVKIFLLIVVNTVVILGGTRAEHIPLIKSKSVEESEKDVFPDLLFFASYLYQ